MIVFSYLGSICLLSIFSSLCSSPFPGELKAVHVMLYDRNSRQKSFQLCTTFFFFFSLQIPLRVWKMIELTVSVNTVFIT